MVRGVAAGGRAGGGRRPACVGLVAALILTLVVACSPSSPRPAPTSTSPTTSTITSTPPPSPTPVQRPVQPPEMQRSDEVGALAAAEYFMRLYEWIYATGELADWDRVSGQTCEFCVNAHEAVAGAYVDGARIEGGTARFSDFSVVDVDDQLIVYGVRLRYSLPEATHLDAAESTLGTIPAESGILVLDVAPSARGWILMDGEIAESEKR